MHEINLKKLYYCKNCQYGPCINNIGPPCFHGSDWETTDQYQITKKLEPVFEINLPKMTPSNMAGLVAKLNGLSEGGKSLTGEQRMAIEMGFQEHIPDNWLRKKQPEPTREESQRRLDEILKFVNQNLWANTSDRIKDIYSDIKSIVTANDHN